MIFVSSSDSFGSDGVASTSDDFEQVQLPPLVGRDLDLVEPHRVLRELRDRPRVARLVGARVDRFGVVGDEVLLHPARLAC